MKKIKYGIFIITLCINIIQTKGQTPNSWSRVADFGGGIRDESISFSIDSFGYVGLGFYRSDTFPYTVVYQNDLWQYNPVSNTWVQKANFPGVGRSDRVCFTLDGKAYIGLGDNYGTSITYNDFWQYDPLTDSWSQKANFTGGTRALAIGFSIASKGYVGLGLSDTSTNYKQDIWEYDPTADTWTQKNDFAGGGRADAISFSIGNNGYVGFGDSSYNTLYYYSDLWQYDPVADTWIPKEDFGGKPPEIPFVFCIGSSGYIGTGTDSSNHILKDFWEYNSLTDQWIEKDSFGGTMRIGAAAFSIGNIGYAGTGDTTSTEGLCKDFWMYTPDSIATGIRGIDVSSISIYPDPATDRLYIGGLSQAATLTITDMTGRVCATPTGSEIDVSALPSGVYCLRIQDSGGSVVRKFVKE